MNLGWRVTGESPNTGAQHLASQEPEHAGLLVREPYVVGLDLGQAQDPTALVVVERCPGTKATGPVTHRVRHLRRWPLWTPYPKVVADVRELLERPPLKKATVALVVDATGVGAAVVDLFEDAGLGAWVVPVTITAGAEAHEGSERWRVPKRDLVGILQVLLQHRRLRIAKALPDVGRLLEELEQFRVEITDRGRDTYAAAAGAHDDLVVAMALACWYGELVAPARIEGAPAQEDVPAYLRYWPKSKRDLSDDNGPAPETSDWLI